jgi:hypothetical protein
MITSAQQYRELGLSVFPVGRDKHPLVEWKPYQEDLPHADEIDVWWSRWPEANIGVATGKVSGLVVLDAEEASPCPGGAPGPMHIVDHATMVPLCFWCAVISARRWRNALVVALPARRRPG